MLTELRIRNFAIIDSLALPLAPGFNVLTGETGAGKSIIVGALGLLLGDRAVMGAQAVAEAPLLLEPRLQVGIAGDGALDAGPADVVQLAVDESHQHVVIDRHHAASSSWTRAWRPRVSREVSVPIGMSSNSAASR